MFTCVCGASFGASSLLPPYGSRGMSLGCQAWEQALLYAKPPCAGLPESFGREEGWLSYPGSELSFNPKPVDKGLILAAWSLKLHVFLLLL